jgi:hypothetical protein
MTGKIIGALREQSDWEQQDENRLGFIKNKPKNIATVDDINEAMTMAKAYADSLQGGSRDVFELLPSTEITFNRAEDGDTVAFVWQHPQVFSVSKRFIENGCVAQIVFDGTLYEYEISTYPYINLGNLVLFGEEDNGVPFAFVLQEVDDGFIIAIFSIEERETAVVSCVLTAKDCLAKNPLPSFELRTRCTASAGELLKPDECVLLNELLALKKLCVITYQDVFLGSSKFETVSDIFSWVYIEGRPYFVSQRVSSGTKGGFFRLYRAQFDWGHTWTLDRHTLMALPTDAE